MYIKEEVALELAVEMTDDSPSSELLILLLKVYRVMEYITISSTHGIAYSVRKNKNPSILTNNNNPFVVM